MSTNQMQEQLDITTATMSKIAAYTEIFLSECSIGNLNKAEEVREILHTLLDVRLDSAMNYITLARKSQGTK